MWVFGYGSLMWDGWEKPRRCIRSAPALARGCARVFNKASIRNWGTQHRPCPTLNLVKSEHAECRGLAFEFPDSSTNEIIKYLEKREGRGFVLRRLEIELDTGEKVDAIVPIYEGNNLVRAEGLDQLAEMALQASGQDGLCVNYVKRIRERLAALAIEDPAVDELWRALRQAL